MGGPGFVFGKAMPNRLDSLAKTAAPRALEKARTDLSRTGRPEAADESAAEPPPASAIGTITPAEAAAGLSARLDLLRARLAKAQEDTLSALLFHGDAQQDCAALAEICAAADWPLTGEGVALLSDCLRRTLPTEKRHLDLIGLLLDALYALRRAEMRPDMGQAGHELLRGLRLAVARELGTANA